MTLKNYTWDQFKADFISGISMSEFQRWLSRASLKEINARQVVVEVPNKFIAHWLQENYTDQIQTIFKDKFNTLPEIRFTYADPPDPIQPQIKGAVKGRNSPRFHGIDPHSTFGDFIMANCNRLACSSALSVAQRPGGDYNPLYIYSELSLGKTHILNAIGNLVLQNNPRANITYLTADRFLNEVSGTLDVQHTNRFWETEKTPDFLLLDDIHLIAGQRKLQAELLALCSSCLESAGQLVVTAAYAPGKIRNLLPQLRSRLEWGLIAEIRPPGQRTKVKIIKKIAGNEKLTLPEDVAFFLANTTDDMKTLIQHIGRIKDYFFSYKRPINLSVAELIIKAASPSSCIDINHIQGVTAKYFNISLTDLLSDKRGRPYSYPRQAAIYLSKKLTPLSLKEIGRAFGNRHHSTVIYADKCIRKAKANNAKISQDIDDIQNLLF
jgi:chromosomal replication initiator protein